MFCQCVSPVTDSQTEMTSQAYLNNAQTHVDPTAGVGWASTGISAQYPNNVTQSASRGRNRAT